MSEASDALAEAMVLNRRLAASRIVRRDEIETELKRLRSGPEGPEVAARIEALTSELGLVQAEYDAALAEIAELRKLAPRVGASVPPTGEADDLEGSALDAARRHVSELVSRAGLGDAPAPDLSTAGPGRPSATEAEARARAELAELKAKRARAERGEDEPPLKKTL